MRAHARQLDLFMTKAAWTPITFSVT